MRLLLNPLILYNFYYEKTLFEYMYTIGIYLNTVKHLESNVDTFFYFTERFFLFYYLMGMTFFISLIDYSFQVYRAHDFFLFLCRFIFSTVSCARLFMSFFFSLSRANQSLIYVLL